VEVTDILDAKEKQLLDFYHGKLKNADFDEKDILIFFILVRDVIKRSNSLSNADYDWILEIGDLVAHRERKQGKIYANLKALSSHIKDCLDPTKNLNNLYGKVQNFNGLTLEQFAIMLNSLLKALCYSHLEKSIVADILLCVFSIANRSRYIEEGSRQNFGKVIVIIIKDYIILASDDSNPIQHRIISKIPNVYGISEFDNDDFLVIHCSNPITIIRNNGKLAIEYCDQDVIKRREKEYANE